MVIVFDPLVMTISGRLGNLVYFLNRNRQFARKYIVPRNPDTAAQRCRRELFSSAVETWRNLPLYKKEQWRAKAFSGRISGYNLFISKIMRQKEDVRSSLFDRKHVLSVCLNKSPSVPPVTAVYDSCNDRLFFVDYRAGESEYG